MKVNIITLGCSKNLVDSELLGGFLTQAGMEVRYDGEQMPFDVVIINTCGFIDQAKEEAIDTILAVCEEKSKGNVGKIIACGCLINLYKQELQQELKEVDAFFGTAQQKEIAQYINDNSQDANAGVRKLSTPRHYAYLKISEGCDRKCSFCSIPLIRGKHISRPIEDLVAEAKALVNQGVKELILIAQDTTYYGVDIYGKRRLGDLIRELAKIESLVWIRIQYAYPNQFPLEILELMKTEPKLCKYIDMPLQHINDEVLQSMRRNIDGKQTRALVEQIKKEIPDIAFRTTLIAGYSGETKQQFNELKAFVKQMRFDRLGVFEYSPQEGTAAYLLPDSVSQKEKSRRLNELMEMQQEISLEINQAKIGKVFNIIIDREEGEYWIGRTEYDSPEVDNEVLVSKKFNLRIGDFVRCKITEGVEFDLMAEPVDASLFDNKK
ncbi:MAG: 30S ribosomal protein S12 methylthiotransferase RimO [Bacteroidales bacterium]|jgi:ribosomal protein S12 methylthiotransferase|nr:30S ribosomal protein S12 methylthiotransferase RimO [Bacteroidales bacterium]